jgi:hypothetical protein
MPHVRQERHQGGDAGELLKLSKQVKSVDLLQVLHHNDATTSLVEVPCSSKQSGFKRRARKSRWVQRILKSVRRHKNKDLLVDEHDDDAEMMRQHTRMMTQQGG